MGSYFFFDSIFINFLNFSGIYIEFESLVNIFVFNNYLEQLPINALYTYLDERQSLLLDELGVLDSFFNNMSLYNYQKKCDFFFIQQIKMIYD